MIYQPPTKTVVIVRGIPGSGKSTFLKNSYPKAEVCSADHYFMDEQGNYTFNHNELHNCHKKCMARFISLVDTESPLIAVDNTCTRLWELSPYMSIAEAKGYKVELFRLEARVEDAASRNAHGVPLNQIKHMFGRMEKALARWNEKVILT